MPNDCDLSPERRILRRDGPEHGGQVDVPAAGRDGRAARAGRARSCRPTAVETLGRRPHLHARRRRRPPVARRVHVHGRDARVGGDPARGDDPAASSSSTRSGRGTSTFDGLSIAWALLEYLHDAPERAAFVLFATHYHELTEIALVKPAVVERHDGGQGDRRKGASSCARSCPGAADRSYGIHVAELAGLPAGGDRARPGDPRQPREAGARRPGRARARATGRARARASGQLLLFTAEEELALEKLRAVDVNQLTPVAALSLLASLQERLKGPDDLARSSASASRGPR